MTVCYECDASVYELSPRSRCVSCEYRRAIFNEKEAAKAVDTLHAILALAEEGTKIG
jgi:hypothetical protein